MHGFRRTFDNGAIHLAWPTALQVHGTDRRGQICQIGAAFCRDGEREGAMQAPYVTALAADGSHATANQTSHSRAKETRPPRRWRAARRNERTAMLPDANGCRSQTSPPGARCGTSAGNQARLRNKAHRQPTPVNFNRDWLWLCVLYVVLVPGYQEPCQSSAPNQAIFAGSKPRRFGSS